MTRRSIAPEASPWNVQEEESPGVYKYDAVGLDAPATGHALSFLDVPRTLLETVPPGALASEAKLKTDTASSAWRMCRPPIFAARRFCSV